MPTSLAGRFPREIDPRRPPTNSAGPRKGTRLLLCAIACIWALGWVPNLLLMFEQGRTVNESLSAIRRTTFLSSSSTAAFLIITVLLLVVAIAGRHERPTTSSALPIVLIAPWLTLYIGHIVFREGTFAYRELAYPLLIVAFYYVGPRVSDVTRLLSHLAIITACMAILMSILYSDLAFMPTWWNNEKAFLFDSILAGPYAHSNQLGTSLALAVPLVWVGFYGWRRAAYTLVIVAAIVWSASRASLAAVAAFLLVAIAISVLSNSVVKRRILQFSIGFALFFAIFLPYMTDDPEAYTRRGLIWQESFEYWSLSPLTGWGPDILSEPNSLTRAIGAFSNTSHNIWLTFATTGGLLTLIGLVALLAAYIFRASRMFSVGETGPLFFILGLSLVEIAEDPVRALHLGPQSYMVWGGLVLMLCTAASPSTARDFPSTLPSTKTGEYTSRCGRDNHARRHVTQHRTHRLTN